MTRVICGGYMVYDVWEGIKESCMEGHRTQVYLYMDL